tara:strand:- start:5235 stop:5681 length:447 start_codon:yes stop_codon:yes gene_type:complete
MADLTVTLTENITVDGHQYGGTKSFTVSGINEVFRRKVTCPNGHSTTIATFAADVKTAANAIAVGDAKYIRITNIDTSDIELAIVGAATLYQITLSAGQTHVLGSPDDLMLAEADTSPSFGTMADIASIQVQPVSSSPVDIEILVASV